MAAQSSSLVWSLLAVAFLIAGVASVQSACGHHHRYRKPRADTYEWQGYFVALTILLGSGCGLAWCILIVTYNMGQREGQDLPQIPAAGEQMPAAMGHQDKLTEPLTPGMNREKFVSFGTLPVMKIQVPDEEDQPWPKSQVSNEEVQMKSQLDTSKGSRSLSQLNITQRVQAPSQQIGREAVSSPSQMTTNEGVRTLYQVNEANMAPSQMTKEMRAPSQLDNITVIGTPSQMNTNGANWTPSQRNLNEANWTSSQRNMNEANWTPSQRNMNEANWTPSQRNMNEANWTPSQGNINELRRAQPQVNTYEVTRILPQMNTTNRVTWTSSQTDANAPVRTPSQTNTNQAIWTPSQNEVPTQPNINMLKRAPTPLSLSEMDGTQSLPPQREGQSSRPEEQSGGTLWTFMEHELERLLGALRLHRTPTPSAAAEETVAPSASSTPSAPAKEATKPPAEEALGLDQMDDKETLMHLIICEVPQERGATRGRGRKRKASRGRK